VIGCPWCIGSDRQDQAIASMRSIDPAYQSLPHAVLFALAVDDLLRAAS
jgi:hypothetical protein